MTKKETKRPKKKGLRKKIIITILVIGVFPLVFGIYLSYLEAIDALTKSIGTNFAAMAKETANKLEIILEEELNEAMAISLMPDIIEAIERSNLHYKGKGEEEVGKGIQTRRERWSHAAGEDPFIKDIVNNKAALYLKSLPHYVEEYIAILVTDERGALVAATDRGYDYYQGDQKWWQAIHQDSKKGVFISDINYDKEKRYYLMETAFPIYTRGGVHKQRIGALHILYKADMIFKIIGDVRIGRTGHANLVSGSGEIIICPIFPPKSHSINEKLIREIVSRISGWGIAEDDGHGGRDSIVGFYPLRLSNQLVRESFSGNSWYVFIRQHPTETYAPIKNLLSKVSFLVFSLIGVLTLMGFYASKKIVEPILLLKKESELIGEGNLDHRVDVRTGDEIESLADEFNSMAERLKTYHTQLKTERDKLEGVILSAGEGIVVADSENRVVMINPVAEKILGVTMQEVKGRSIFPCHKNPGKVQHLLRLDGALPMQITIPVGSKIVEINVTLIKSDEEMIGSMMMLRDITLVKYMEKELKKHSEQLENLVYSRTKEINATKEYLENLLENANDVIYTLNRDGMFTYVNQKVEMWGYEKEELVGQPFQTLLVTEEAVDKGVVEMAEIKPTSEIRIRNKKGEVRDLLVRTSPLKGDEGAVIGVLGIATDITDRKRLEEQMMRTEKLSAIGQLSMGVAHEINNPLSGMMNCVRTLTEEGEDESLRKRYLVLLEKGLDRIESIVRQLLGFAKEYKFEFAPCEIDDLIMDTIRLIDHKIKRGDIRLQLNLNCKERKYLLPANHIQQVILNIVINAIHAMPQGGILTIETYEGNKNLIAKISDTGIGIPKENLKRIFDPFFTTKDVGVGTGLGLSLSYGIIKKLGGEIEVKSEVGKGSTFKVVMPPKPGE